MYKMKIAIPDTVRTALDSMTLLNRFLFNETVEDPQTYNDMIEILTILVAPFDIFGYGLYRYTFEEQCLEIPELKLNDGARRIFINASGENPENFSKEFLDFMKYIVEPSDDVVEKSGSEKIRRIHERVCRIKRSEKTGVKLMQQWEEIYYEKKQAREEGFAEGRDAGFVAGHTEGHAEGLAKGLAEGHLQLLKEFVRAGMISPLEAANRLKMSIEEFQLQLDKE